MPKRKVGNPFHLLAFTLFAILLFAFFFFLFLRRQQLYKWFFPNSLFSSRLLLGRNWIQHIGRHMPRSCVKYIIPPRYNGGPLRDDAQCIWPTLRPSKRAVYVRERSEGYVSVEGKKRERKQKKRNCPFFSLSLLYIIDTKGNQVGRTDCIPKGHNKNNARGFIR